MTVTDHFFVNASVNLPFSMVKRNANYILNDMGVISITARYERDRFGIYLPVIYNTKTKLHVGAAVRMGPLIVGLNNLNVFNNDLSLQNTSGYFSFLFRIKPRVNKPNRDFIKSPQKVL